MTEPSQYFKGRTVQEQMNEVIGYVDTRAAEVATTAIASDVAQVHQDMLDADADAAAAAASAAAAAGTLANAVKKTGEASQSIAGDIAITGTLSGGVVTGTVITAPAPVNNTDAANKKYVDDQDALDAKLAGATFTGQLKASGQRAYSPGNTTDVATIGTLDNYTPMVRTSGNQTIGGMKTFTSGAAFQYYKLEKNGPGCDYIDTADPSATATPDSLHQTLFAFRSADNGLNFLFQFQHTSSGNKQFIVQMTAENGTPVNYRVCGVDKNGNTLSPGYI